MRREQEQIDWQKLSLYHPQKDQHGSYHGEYFDMNTVTSTFELEPIITSSEPHTFIIYIMSAIGNIDNRMAIRNTWTNKVLINRFPQHKFHVERFFTLGGLGYIEKDLANEIRSESEKYQDILIIDSLEDQYGILTLKTLYSMQWINNHCNLSNVDFMMKADDDTLMNIYFILKLGWEELQKKMNPFHFLLCFQLSARPAPHRGKWGEDPLVYNGDYVSHCQGSSYTFHIRTFRMMIQNIHTIPILKNEDAMLTGLCLKNYNITRNRVPRDRLLPAIDKKSRETFVQSKQYLGINGLKVIPRGYHCWANSSLCMDQLYAMVHSHNVPIELWPFAFQHMDEDYLLENQSIKSIIDNREKLS